MKKLQDYIGKRVIIKAKNNKSVTIIGRWSHPIVLKEVTKTTVKVLDERSDTIHEIKIDNLYLVWERIDKNELFGNKATRGDVLYASEKNIKKRREDILKLGGNDYYALVISAELLAFITLIFAMIKTATYAILIGPWITSPMVINGLTTIMTAVGPTLFFITLSQLVWASVISTMALLALYFFLPRIIKAPLFDIQSKWTEEYIQLLEYKSNISLLPKDGES